MNIVVPGQRLVKSDKDCVAGPGTYARGGAIYASLFGAVSTGYQTNTPLVRVDVVGSMLSQAVPEVGDVVTCKVTSINPRFAKVVILCVGDKPLKESFHGMIRQYDVRDTERDKVVMQDAFRPGDVVRACVISLGDARSYVLTTAAVDFGVVYAETELGAALVPVSWCEMQCETTGAKVCLHGVACVGLYPRAPPS